MSDLILLHLATLMLSIGAIFLSQSLFKLEKMLDTIHKLLLLKIKCLEIRLNKLDGKNEQL